MNSKMRGVNVLLILLGVAGGCSSSSSSSAPACASSGQQCPGGQPIQACMTKDSNGACASIDYQVGSQTFSCNSCTDVTGCTQAAIKACSPGGPASSDGGGTSGTSVHCSTMTGPDTVCFNYAGLMPDQVSMAQTACTQGMGTVVASCPTSNVIGCCTMPVGRLSTEACYYGSSNPSAYMTACSSQNGTWSTSPDEGRRLTRLGDESDDAMRRDRMANKAAVQSRSDTAAGRASGPPLLRGGGGPPLRATETTSGLPRDAPPDARSKRRRTPSGAPGRDSGRPAHCAAETQFADEL